MVNSGAPMRDGNSSFKSTYSSFHIFSAILRGTGGELPPTPMASDDGSWGGAGMTDATALLGDSVVPVVLAVGGAVLALGELAPPPGELNTGSGMILGASPPDWKPYVARVSARHTAGCGVIGLLCGACRNCLWGR